MTILQVELYEALKKAGVDNELAKKASSAVFEAKDMVVKNENKFDSGFDKLETRISSLQTEMQTKISSLQREVRLVGGVIISLLVAVIVALLVK